MTKIWVLVKLEGSDAAEQGESCVDNAIDDFGEAIRNAAEDMGYSVDVEHITIEAP